MLSHANLLSSARGLCRGGGHPRHRRAPVLPADGVDRQFAVLAGADTCLSGSPATVPERPRDRAARSARARPDDRDRAAADLGEHADPAAGQGGRFDAAEASALRVLPRPRRAGGAAARAKASRSVADLAAGPRARRGRWSTAPVRDQLGLRRARWVYTGGAPLGPDTFRFFRSFGVNIKQVWGSTELVRSRLVAARRRGGPGHGRPGHTGHRGRGSPRTARC